MANNIPILDATSTSTIVKSTDNAGVHTPHQNAQLQVGGTDVSGTNPVPGLLKAYSTSGTISALNGAVTLAVDGHAGAAIDLRGTFTATITFQGTIDGTTFFNLVATPVASAANVATVSTATAAGAWYVQCTGCVQIRAIATAYTSGTVTATLRATASQAWTYQAPIGATNAIAGTVTANLGTGALNAGTAAIGDVGVQYRANATGAGTASNYASPATPAGQSIKASAGRLLCVSLSNTAAAVRWVKFFNQTTVTMGTTSAAFEQPIPAMGILEFSMEGGIAFSTGIQIAVTSARGLTDNTSAGLALGDVSGFIVNS